MCIYMYIFTLKIFEKWTRLCVYRLQLYHSTGIYVALQQEETHPNTNIDNLLIKWSLGL